MSAPSGPEDQPADLRIELGLPAADAEEVDEATARLRQELLELDVDQVNRPVIGEAPEGARAAEVLALGGLVVTLARNAGTIGAVIGALQSWVTRDRTRSVKLELDGETLEVTGVSSREQERLIEAWISRHSTP
jgi:hypothetical protein